MTETGLDFESFLQADFWLAFKSRFGWQANRLPDFGGIGILSRPVGPFGRLTYCPRAPVEVPAPDDFSRLVDDIAGLSHPTLIRFDLPWGRTPEALSAARSIGLWESPVAVQPSSTVIIDLDAEDNELLSRMKSKTRYNVRLAAKRGVRVRQAGAEELSLWYELYRETALRDRITIHSEDYYRGLFGAVSEFQGDGDLRIQLSFAEFEGLVLGGIIVVDWRGTATYLYGASSNRRRELMAPYLLQWEAIRGARSRGNSRYDLFGIPPTADPGHPMHGLYRFKTGFGGRVVHSLGAWDYALKPLRYSAYRGAERLRNYYHKVVRKRGG